MCRVPVRSWSVEKENSAVPRAFARRGRRRIALGLGLVFLLPVSTVVPVASAESVDVDGKCTTTAASTFGWGEPNRSDDFDSPSSLNGWKVYDTVGHVGNGRRTPDAMSVSDGLLTITGDSEGNSGGMAWMPGQLYGRWEVCMKSPPGSENYHSVVLLWPDSENWPADGEIDFMEILEPTRQVVTASVLHLKPGDPALKADPNDYRKITIDATQWRAWAVEWAPDRIRGYVDGNEWFEVDRHIPTTPMHLAIQLDNFGGDISQGGQQIVDWVRQYPI